MPEFSSTRAALLLAYSLLYFLIAFVWRSVTVWRTTGINPVVLTYDDSAYGYIGRGMRGVLLTWLALAVMAAAVPQMLRWLGPILPVIRPEISALGWGLLLCSLAWIAAAQSAMGSSWRVGIDRANQTALIRRGPFALSRNPIFLGMRLNLLGLFLVLPNAVTLGVLVAGELLMQVQVRLEEQHLSQMHGQEYAEYRQQVPRWL